MAEILFRPGTKSVEGSGLEPKAFRYYLAALVKVPDAAPNREFILVLNFLSHGSMSDVVNEKTLLKCFRDAGKSTATEEERALGLLSLYPHLVSFPDRIFRARRKNGSGQLPIPFSFKCAGMLAHCSFLI